MDPPFKPVHIPVLLKEVLNSFESLSSGEDLLFIDGTGGEGGHTEALLNHFSASRVVLLDRDPEMIERSKERLENFQNRIYTSNQNFSDFTEVDLLAISGKNKVDGILLDLGISTYHYEGSGRGFSFGKKEILDMRLGDKGIPAYEILKKYPEKKLFEIFWNYSEERWSKKIASVIVEKRRKVDLKYSSDLADLIASIIPRKFWPPKAHPATRIFQALRIEVNQELKHIEIGLPVLFALLKEEGIFSVISFHSLEDRIVKNIFKNLKQEKKVHLLTKKPISPTEKEISSNKASRSAKLRSISKLGLDKSVK